MYSHIGCYKWEKGYLHLFYELDKFKTYIEEVGNIKMPASIMFMGTDAHIITEFVKKKIIKHIQVKRKVKGCFYFYRGVSHLELIDTIEYLKKYFKIDKNKFDELKTKLVAAAI